IRDRNVTGVQTCALPIFPVFGARKRARELAASAEALKAENGHLRAELARTGALDAITIDAERIAARGRFEAESTAARVAFDAEQIGRASCRQGEERAGAA